MGTLTASQFHLFVDRPENIGKRWELVRGLPKELPPWPAEYHRIHMRIVQVLGDYVIGRGKGSVAFLKDGIITSTGPDTVRSPAVMVFSQTAHLDDFASRYSTEIPQLVVDLVPPQERYGQYINRISDYANSGVQLIWAVEPEDRSLTLWTSRNPPTVLDETEELSGNGVLPEFSCRVAELFALPGQPQPPTA